MLDHWLIKKRCDLVQKGLTEGPAIPKIHAFVLLPEGEYMGVGHVSKHPGSRFLRAIQKWYISKSTAWIGNKRPGNGPEVLHKPWCFKSS